MNAKEIQQYGTYRPTGTGDFALSNRVSYEMDLRGPRHVFYGGPIIIGDAEY